MSQLAQTGQFCPNPNCDRFNNTHDHALIKHGQTKQDKQRYRCKACGKTFSENKGTIFYGKQKPPDLIIETLLLIAEGTGIRPRLASKTSIPKQCSPGSKRPLPMPKKSSTFCSTTTASTVRRSMVCGATWGKKGRRREPVQGQQRSLLAQHGDRARYALASGPRAGHERDSEIGRAHV